MLDVASYPSDEDPSTSSGKRSWFASWFGGSQPSKSSVQQVTVPKFVEKATPQSLQLSKALQYGASDVA